MSGATHYYDGAGNLFGAIGSGTRLLDTYSATNQLTRTQHGTGGQTDVVYDSVNQAQRAEINRTSSTGTSRQQLENTAIGITALTTNGVRSDFVRDSSGTLIGQVTGTGENLYAITDYQGSTVGLIDGNQQAAAVYSYNPYGQTQMTGRAAAGNPFRWIASQQVDDGRGTYLTGYRQHDPGLARFTQPDPSQQEPNPYTYGLANPISYSDPTGLISGCDLYGGIVGGLFGLGPRGKAAGAVLGFVTGLLASDECNAGFPNDKFSSSRFCGPLNRSITCVVPR